MKYDIFCQWCGDDMEDGEYMGEDHEFAFCCHTCEDEYYANREARGNETLLPLVAVEGDL